MFDPRILAVGRMRLQAVALSPYDLAFKTNKHTENQAVTGGVTGLFQQSGNVLNERFALSLPLIQTGCTG